MATLDNTRFNKHVEKIIPERSSKYVKFRSNEDYGCYFCGNEKAILYSEFFKNYHGDNTTKSTDKKDFDRAFCCNSSSCRTKLIPCQNCKWNFDEDSIATINERGYTYKYCKQCVIGLITECTECHKQCFTRSIRRINGQELCTACFTAKYFHCYGCGNSLPKSENYEETGYCHPCWVKANPVPFETPESWLTQPVHKKDGTTFELGVAQTFKLVDAVMDEQAVHSIAEVISNFIRREILKTPYNNGYWDTDNGARIYSDSGHIFKALDESIDWSLDKNLPSIPKRISKMMYDKWGYKITPKLLESIGNKLAQFKVDEPTWHLTLTRDLIRPAKYYGHASSCWFSGYSSGRHWLREHGGMAMLGMNNAGDDWTKVTTRKRAWVLPLNVNKYGTFTTYITDEMTIDAPCYVVFNVYSDRSGDNATTFAKALAHLLGYSYKQISFTSAPGGAYLNTEYCALVYDKDKVTKHEECVRVS